MFFSIAPQDAQRRVPQYFTFLLNINLIIQWPLFAYCLVYHADLVQVVFGGKYVEESGLLPLVIGFASINILGTAATLTAQYREKAGVVLLSKIFAVYNIVAMIVLLPKFGLFGAAFARGSAQAMKNLFIWWHVRGDAIWLNATAAIVGGMAIWGAAVIACLVVRAQWHVATIFHLFAGLIICALAVLIHIRSGVIATTDRQLLASLFQGKESRGLQWLGLMPLTRQETAG